MILINFLQHTFPVTHSLSVPDYTVGCYYISAACLVFLFSMTLRKRPTNTYANTGPMKRIRNVNSEVEYQRELDTNNRHDCFQSPCEISGSYSVFNIGWSEPAHLVCHALGCEDPEVVREVLPPTKHLDRILRKRTKRVE